MSHYTDWLPSRRAGILTMSKTWFSVFTGDTKDSKGQTVQKYAAWGIPDTVITEFGNLYAAADEALTRAQEKETRTAVANAACKTAFDALVEY